MTLEPINPYHLHPSYTRISNGITGAHTYRAVLVKHGRTLVSKKVWKTATLAAEHAERLLARWRRLFDEALAQIADEAMADEKAEP